MSDEQISALIKILEDLGYLFECDGPGHRIGFFKPEDEDGNRSYISWNDWEEVKKFVDNQCV